MESIDAIERQAWLQSLRVGDWCDMVLPPGTFAQDHNWLRIRTMDEKMITAGRSFRPSFAFRRADGVCEAYDPADFQGKPVQIEPLNDEDTVTATRTERAESLQYYVTSALSDEQLDRIETVVNEWKSEKGIA